MKILLLNSVYNFGSTGRIVKDLKYIIQSQGSDGVIVYGRGKKILDDNIFKIGSDLDFRLHVIYARVTDKAGFASSSYTKKMIKKIKEYDPDLINLHNIHGYYLNIELLFNFLREYNKPVLWTLHDCWAFTGHCAHYDAINCQKWQKECNDCPQISEYPKSFIDNSLNNFHRKRVLFTSLKNLYLVTPSIWLRNEVGKSFLKQYPCYTIANGIDLEQFKPNSHHFKQSRCINNDRLKILGVASVWNKRKGFADFIKLSNLLDTDKYEIIMVGVTLKQKKYLERYNIHAIERTDSVSELASLYQAADIFFNPTYEDNFPTTNLESLACGTPVLTYNTGGSPECLTDKCGVVVEKGELEHVVFHINHWKSYQWNRNDCIEQAKKFDKFMKFEEYYKLYNKILCDIKE
ncbi:glycosyltransferase [Glaesserella parasuis]|uniref:glycosyltransferase n=1 Tax=Glaesserella parasuis TaxID=738 RepID=UPI0024369E4B|nr:glycosyltransferase [Glaesserella parasuis]MDG6246507.1 glycosyltransferase [Glaesserella parasuis]